MLKKLSRIERLEQRGVSSSQFSKELIKETIEVFQKENNLLLSEDDAITALNSFAALFMAFSPSEGISVSALKRETDIPRRRVKKKMP